MKKLILSFLILLVSATAWTKVEYDANDLMMKNSEQVAELVRKKLKAASDIQVQQEDNDENGILAEPAAIEKMKDAMRIVLSRPDQDDGRATQFARVRRELSDLGSFEKVLQDLTTEGITALKSKSGSDKIQITYIFLLENLMAELKPDIAKNKIFQKLIEQIRDANLKIDDSIKSTIKLRTMTVPVSPSQTAAKILKK